MDSDRAFCELMLPKVSRTFALCIRLLPSQLEYTVLIAYLLCRIADTIEDAANLSGQDKKRLLCEFASSLDEDGVDPTSLRLTFGRSQAPEETLNKNVDVVLREFRRLSPDQRTIIRPRVQEMCDGMADFAVRYGGGGAPRALATVDDLERYCYFVAGTVGHLLTDLYATVPPFIDKDDHAALKDLATSFGLGLQLTNIIKDVADDRDRGWIFVPEDLCQAEGIGVTELHDPTTASRARAVMHRLIDKAQTHLDDALAYCRHLPRRQYGIRLFCSTAMYFAVRTLRLARADPQLLDPSHKVKITRRTVYATVAIASFVAPSNTLLGAYFRLLTGKRASALAPV